MTASTSGSRPARVLHLRDSPWVDGPGRTIIESGCHFDQGRIEYHIGALVPSPGSTHPMIEAARSRGLSVHAVVDRGGLDLGAVESISRLVDQLQVAILHTSDLRTRLLGLLVHRAHPHLVMVTTAHGWIANTARRSLLRCLDKILLRYFDSVIMVSWATRELVPRWWLPDTRVTVLHNALDLRTYGAAAGFRKHHPPGTGGQVKLLNVGRLSAEKGQDLLLRSVAHLAPEYPGLQLHFAGVGPMESKLRDLAMELGLASRVAFHGFVQDMPALYEDVDLVVQSSLTEGLPNVILEAAYLGVPILATDVGGTREVIDHGRHAWLIPPGSIDALVTGLRHFLSCPVEFQRMADAAHARIVADFSFDARTERMTRIYEGLLPST